MTTVRLVALCVAVCASLFAVAGLEAQDKPKVEADAEELRQKLLGAWTLSGVPEANNPQGNVRMKFWGLKHWLITESDQAGNPVFHHGGTYTLDGNNYSETIKFAAGNTKELLGRTFTFKIKVEGDTYTQTGVGNPWNETWVRLK
jgi:hypothetical protein